MLEFVIEQGITEAMPVVEAFGLKDPTQIVGGDPWYTIGTTSACIEVAAEPSGSARRRYRRC